MSAIGKKKIVRFPHFALSLPIILKKLCLPISKQFLPKKLIIKNLNKNLNCRKSFYTFRFPKK